MSTTRPASRRRPSPDGVVQTFPGHDRRVQLELRRSSIHHLGVFTRTDIPKGAKVLEYVGERITKAESDRRIDRTLRRARRSRRHGAVYVCVLNSRYDVDGDVPHNLARFINHSCEPNCRFLDIGGRLWIVARRRIRAGEEISYNYGYDLSTYPDHPCRCGAPSCVGHILDRAHWGRIPGRGGPKS